MTHVTTSVGFALMVARTGFWEIIVIIVRNLHLYFYIFILHRLLCFIFTSNICFCGFKRATPVIMAQTVLFNVPQIAMEHVNTLTDPVQLVRQAGTVTVAMKVISNDIFC